ncbi:type II toxin-antitoxin system VapC family toxin [Dolichospermum sp. ST_con]|nr:type II toxin-antitoxin system VapC family toxin [Dolichospermum sp. ST_con]MDD1421367.1 type II toxin-antitoxin system VapC family toxin [Dolichospermum sp. ST_sed1]MDD1426811.1 type II toxin-antitoxin system VapC family toxin [Dolichospermum sp. ST_sed9]MDD1432994.1 type II toxin-antitoxin system VapC family toxin [Dolichospermum sp. ST_sed6]MDD1438180.1 type II toxin-antitoxin system VapC family toxin [Dolichospermum sp. ST_sed10]MDD1442620.1 type II toxin-antitoxin system VapC family to
MGYLLDTNIVSAIFKNNQKVIIQLDNLRTQKEKVFMSAMTYYEIERGFLAVKATRKLLDLENLCNEYQVLLLDDMAIFHKASEIYADLKQKGLPIQDADIFIAATAIIHDLILVSHDSDLLRIKELNASRQSLPSMYP